ncbi:MAG: hypothetical protein JNK14_05810 [Chitinophagaceae bacterium]|nr:hypothetical protein [Chitinophagaceae bacterium]
MTDLSKIFSAPFKGVKINEVLAEALSRNEEKILDLNRRQLDGGIGADGKSIGRYANFSYKNRFEPVDLLLTGKFRKEFTLGVKKKEAEIFSQDSKQKILERKYGKDIQGLTSSNMEIAGDIIEDDFSRIFFQALVINA